MEVCDSVVVESGERDSQAKFFGDQVTSSVVPSIDFITVQ
jgi:hypothetical protein